MSSLSTVGTANQSPANPATSLPQLRIQSRAARIGAVSQCDYAIREHLDLAKSVRYINDRNTVIAQVLDDFHQPCGFRKGQA